MTKTEQMERGLIRLGYKEQFPARSKKYREFTRKGASTLWLGKAGALRAGETLTGAYSTEGWLINREALAAGAE